MLIPKDEWERKIFREFVAAAGIDVDLGSITSGTPPEPDVRFTVKGVEHWAELVEVTDEHLAKRHSEKIGSAATEAISDSSRQQKGTLCDYQHVYYSLWPLWPPYSPNYSIP